MSITSDLPNVRVRLETQDYEDLQALARKNERTVAAEVRLAVKLRLKMEKASEKEKRR